MVYIKPDFSNFQDVVITPRSHVANSYRVRLFKEGERDFQELDVTGVQNGSFTSLSMQINLPEKGVYYLIVFALNASNQNLGEIYRGKAIAVDAPVPLHYSIYSKIYPY